MAGKENSDEPNENASVQENTEDFDTLIKQGFNTVMATIRSSNTLPKGAQWDFFCTSPLFKPIMDSLGNKALELMALILHHQSLNHDIRKRDLEEKCELIVDANDKILEKVGIHLDELSGIRRNPQSVSEVARSPVNAPSGSWNKDLTNSAAWKEVRFNQNFQKPVTLRNSRVTQRPQVKFLDKIDNSSTPFEPRIKEKPNALKPLSIIYEALPDEDPCYSHPYEFELDMFQGKIDSLNLMPKQPQYPNPVEETPLVMISQEDQLSDMLKDLLTQTEIAVDLEHHSYRSFQGFTCLMQISTREKDYIIDTLELRHILYVLNEVFTDPKIVKVFHGADSDIQWLQRDLSLYVVNMFDTYQAAKILSLQRLSLAFLLKSFCNIDANKHFQLYDWRTRPLAKEAIKYAREDTHYLLHIYEVLWNKLIEKSNGGTQLLQTVIYRSADTCKKRYWKFIFKEDSYESMYRQSKKSFDNKQMYALKELYSWRDKTAREEDESSGYVLPNHMLLLIAEKLPKEMQGILACCNPIPPLVRQNLVMLHQIILKAREQPLVPRFVTGLNNETRVRPAPQTNVNLEGALHCPHDLTHNIEFRDDLPSLLDSTHTDCNSNTDLSQNEPVLHIFEEIDKVEHSNLTEVSFPNQNYFMSPFERYKKMLLYMESEEAKTKEQKQQEVINDTQRLLDECTRELQEASAASRRSEGTLPEVLTIKEEIQDYKSTSKKRGRSQDNTVDEVTIKSEEDYEEITPRPQMTYHQKVYEEFKSQLLSSTPKETYTTNNKNNSNNEHECPPKKKKKLKNSDNTDEVIPMNVGAKKKNFMDKKNDSNLQNKKKSSENFTPYDYSQVNYSQYQQSEFLETPKRSQEKFKQKGKKKQQNKSFTFARQYGSSSSKKKS